MATDLDFLDEVTAFLETGTSAPSWRAASPTSSMNGDVAESCSSVEKREAKRKKRRIGAAEVNSRRQKYRQNQTNVRDELRQQERELLRHVQELIEARTGARTTAQTDLVLAKSFWKQLALRQRELRLDAEAEKKRLASMVNAQSMYVDSMGILHERPDLTSSVAITTRSRSYDEIDDRKWLRLKSSDAALYDAYLQDLYEGFNRIDKVFEECGMESLSVGTVSTLHRHNPDGGVAYVQLVNKLLQPFSFEDTCSSMWAIADLPYRRLDREVLQDVKGPDNIAAVKFRVSRALSDGSTVSILKRVVARRFTRDDRAVMVWKVFWEGEGIFSGMDIDATGWVCIRPYCDGSNAGAVMEVCSRQAPTYYITSQTKDPTVRAFWTMTQDVAEEDEREIIRLQEKLLRNHTVPNFEEDL